MLNPILSNILSIIFSLIFGCCGISLIYFTYQEFREHNPIHGMINLGGCLLSFLGMVFLIIVVVMNIN